MRSTKFNNKTLSEAFHLTEKSDVSDSLDSRYPMPELCKAEDNMAAYYQWVVTIDGYTIHTDQFVCRKGANAWEFPACPSSACEDDECTICTEGWEKNTQ